ncbi:cation:proton antiporter [Flavisolibacter tropicus]|uniref:cation:proton antiporter n=1 Tax=Flavisolibacter tropicus TaxID=1492898 RepID=UPI001D049005|nr:sodium:proton antiporter [Flavisolibacter tropicus]
MQGVDSYIISITLIGIAALGMAWMPSITERTQISYSIIYVLFGIALYELVDHLPKPNPILHDKEALHLTELVVIISLMGTGLKIDQPFSLKSWAVPFRLITFTMIVCIAAVTWVAHWLLGFDLASSLLLGAVLAPTDPVLASDVQVGPPLEKSKDNVRFSLTAEAGMNDGMAFPFTWLAIIVAAIGIGGSSENLVLWFTRDVLYRLAAGVACGVGIGLLLARLVFYLPEKRNFVVIRDGFVAVSATLLVYGLTEMVKGYGFIAVFVTAITLRNYELGHNYHRKLHDFTDQIERILLAIVLILFGGSIVGGILKPLTLPMVVFSFGFVLLIRPVAGLLGLIGTRHLHLKEKLGISFFGIRGMGSFFYLAFAFEKTRFPLMHQLWAIVAFIVLLSLVLHGLTASKTMKKLESQFNQPLHIKEVKDNFRQA